MSEKQGEVLRRLEPASAAAETLERVALDESEFRWRHNEDAMATEKLADGIRRFDADARKLEALVAGRRAAQGPVPGPTGARNA